MSIDTNFKNKLNEKYNGEQVIQKCPEITYNKVDYYNLHNDSNNDLILSDDFYKVPNLIDNGNVHYDNFSDSDKFSSEHALPEFSETNLKKYMEPTILENINLEKYFTKEDIDLSNKNNIKLKITDKGLYSISKHSDSKWISDIIFNFLKNVKYKNINNIKIIDGTAGIGGNTISFAKYFSEVYAVEINDTHYDVLNNNLKALNIINVQLYLNNFLNILDDLSKKSNIFFFDPPWGGKSYKNFKYFNLKIGKLPINDVINMLYDKNFKYVILKAPYNLNITPIYLNIKYENMNIHTNNKNNMILTIFY
jgi:16S rRNA G966 N2-methylase RsmD